MSSNVIAIDLDGTLTSWERGDSSQANGIGDWIPGAKDALDTFLKMGFRIMVHTCRATWEAGGSYAGVRKFLDDAGYTEDRGVFVWHEVGKPIARFYIDDRAIQFTGHWGRAMTDVAVRIQDEQAAIPGESE